MKTVLLTIIGMLIALATVGALIIGAGSYNVAADEPHTTAVFRLLETARERSIRAMQRHYHVDLEQAARVEATAATLLEQVARSWQLADQRSRQLLVWAARLHEVGLDIAHARYHHHGGYLIANSDLPGFVRLEQQLVA